MKLLEHLEFVHHGSREELHTGRVLKSNRMAGGLLDKSWALDIYRVRLHRAQQRIDDTEPRDDWLPGPENFGFLAQPVLTGLVDNPEY